MKLFAKLVNGWNPPITFTKRLDVWLGSEYASVAAYFADVIVVENTRIMFWKPFSKNIRKSLKKVLSDDSTSLYNIFASEL